MSRRQKQHRIPSFLMLITWGLIIASLATLAAPLVMKYQPKLLTSYFWWMELFTHFPLHIAGGALLLAIYAVLTRHRQWAYLLVFIAASQWTTLSTLANDMHAPMHFNDASLDKISVLQFNVFRHNQNINQAKEWLLNQQEQHDLIVLFEANPEWNGALEELKPHYPFFFRTPVRGDREIVVLSRLPNSSFHIESVEGETTKFVTLHAESLKNRLPLSFYFSHPETPILPWDAASRWKVLSTVADHIARDPLPYKFWIGDFNLTRFSPINNVLEKNTDLYDRDRHGEWFTSWPSILPYGGILIDRALLSKNIAVEEVTPGIVLGSDHLPVHSIFSLHNASLNIPSAE